MTCYFEKDINNELPRISGYESWGAPYISFGWWYCVKFIRTKRVWIYLVSFHSTLCLFTLKLYILFYGILRIHKSEYSIIRKSVVLSEKNKDKISIELIECITSLLVCGSYLLFLPGAPIKLQKIYFSVANPSCVEENLLLNREITPLQFLKSLSKGFTNDYNHLK